MHKLKTKKAAAKRYKVTGTGKIKRNKSNTQHILGKKTTKRKRKLRKGAYLSGKQAKNIKKMVQG